MTDEMLPTCRINRLALIDDVSGQVVEFDLTPPVQDAALVPQETAIVEAVADLHLEIVVPKEYAMSKEAQDAPKQPEEEVAEGQVEETPQTTEVSGDTEEDKTEPVVDEADEGCPNCSAEPKDEEPEEPQVEDEPAPETPEVTPEPVVNVDTTVIETMASELERRKSQVARLENALSDTKAELDEVRKELDELQADSRTQLVNRVMDLRLSLDKPDVREAQTEEGLTEIRTELEKRTIESLRDSAQDLQLELAVRRTGTTISPATPPAANPSPTGGPSGGNPASPDKSKTLDKLRSGK
jgi:hypothetical protein